MTCEHQFSLLDLSQMVNIDHVSAMAWGIIAIGIGALALFLGIKIFRVAVGVAGFGAFGLGAYILTGQVYRSLGVDRPDGKDLVRIGVSLSFGLLGAFISVWLWKVALVSLGILGGLGLSLYILSWKSNGVISQPTYRTVFISVFGVMGAVASFFLEKVIIITATSIVGSISVCAGIDVFANTGFNHAFGALMKNKGQFTLSGPSYALLASCGFLAAIGGVFQWQLSKTKTRTKTVA